MIIKKSNRRQFIKTIGFATGAPLLLSSCNFFTGHRKAEQFADHTPWLEKAAAHVLTPASGRVMPVSVAWTEGQVENSQEMLKENGRNCRLTYREDSIKPVAVLDFGAQSLGGYAVFNVTGQTNQPVLRLAYACHPDGLSENGCFTRETSARYLGPTIDLPVLPGNINRHELYTIPRTGIYIAPLIQGQTRYIRVQLETPGTSVDIDTVIMVNSRVYDQSPHDGFFLCSDERINRLWYISTWTVQIASLPDHDAWRTVEGWLLPRKLEQADDVGLSNEGSNWGDVTIETIFEIRSNPHYTSSAGIAFRARDARNAYLAEVSLDGIFKLIRRVNGMETVISEKRLDQQLTDGIQYTLKVEASGPVLTTRLDDVVIDETKDDVFSTGRVGFYTPKEKWPLFNSIHIRDAKGQTLLFDDFTGDLSSWEFARTLSFIADGAKRDRLVWSGDLYFAQPSVYCAFANPTYMRDSLLMLAFNQTPDGFVHAAPYPENAVPPELGNYGHFQSDEFAAWLIPVAWDHLLYTNDKATLRRIWPAVDKLLVYLQSHIGSNGLFKQRFETSKHAGNLDLGDTRSRSFMNILLWGAFRDASRIADHLEMSTQKDNARLMADKMKKAVLTHFWDEKNGFFKEAIETPGLGFHANALALAMGLVEPEEAKRIAPNLTRVGHGKFQSLASRGKFEYGFGQSGLRAIFDHNWLRLLDDNWKGATTTTETMAMITRGWGDESHPDTAIAGHFSEYLLGVAPTEPGYRRFRVRPLPLQEVLWAKGKVPTPNGSILASWSLNEDTLKLDLAVPRGTLADVEFPPGCRIFINGNSSDGKSLSSGLYTIEAREIPPGAWHDHTMRYVSDEKLLIPLLKASSTIEEDGLGLDYLFAPVEDKSKRGYSSAAHDSAEAFEWIEIDLGSEIALSKIVLLPRSDSSVPDAGPSGFPGDFAIQLATQPGNFNTVATVTGSKPDSSGLSFDLYTVIGYPSARYIKLIATRLGNPASYEPGKYRLQLERILLVRP